MAVSCFVKERAVISREECLRSRIYEFVCDHEGRQAETKAFFFGLYIGYYKSEWPIFKVSLLTSNDLDGRWILPPQMIQLSPAACNFSSFQ